MKFLDQDIIRNANQFKELALRELERIGLQKNELSAEFGVSEQSVSRWFHPFDDSNFPAFLFGVCLMSKNKKVHDFGLALLKLQCNPAEFNVIKNIAVADLNGSLQDEVCSIVEELGNVATSLDIPIEEACKLMDNADNIISYAFSMKAEIRKKMK